MKYNFDQIVDRRDGDSVKWNVYESDVLPLWVADMDFVSPLPVVEALQQRAAQAVFGYGMAPPEYSELLVERLQRLYGWSVAPEALVFLPGVVTGFNLACRTVAQPGNGVLFQTPIYPPILSAPGHHGLLAQPAPLSRRADGTYGVDIDHMQSCFTGQTRLFILCNPHNPVGRVFSQAELEQMAELCLRRDVIICSDEIHCDLLFQGARHIPIAGLDPEIARRTITLMAPSKTYNIAGLHCSVAIIQDEALRRRFKAARAGLVSEVGVLAYAAAVAAYRAGDDWLVQVLAYMQANRDLVVDFVNRRLPGLSVASPEATYLAWIDCRAAQLPPDPYHFFLERARLAFNDGAAFGENGQGFVRLNFATPRAILLQALERMAAALPGLEKDRPPLN